MTLLLLLETMVPDENKLKLFSFVLKLLCAEVWILKGSQSVLGFDKKKLVNVSHHKCINIIPMLGTNINIFKRDFPSMLFLSKD